MRDTRAGLVLFLSVLIFIPIHIGILYLGKPLWYLLELALMGGVTGCVIVYGAGYFELEKTHWAEIAFVYPLGSIFGSIFTFGFSVLIASEIAKWAHLDTMFVYPEVWKILVSFLVGYELLFWPAFYLSKKLRKY